MRAISIQFFRSQSNELKSLFILFDSNRRTKSTAMEEESYSGKIDFSGLKDEKSIEKARLRLELQHRRKVKKLHQRLENRKRTRKRNVAISPTVDTETAATETAATKTDASAASATSGYEIFTSPPRNNKCSYCWSILYFLYNLSVRIGERESAHLEHTPNHALNKCCIQFQE